MWVCFQIPLTAHVSGPLPYKALPSIPPSRIDQTAQKHNPPTLRVLDKLTVDVRVVDVALPVPRRRRCGGGAAAVGRHVRPVFSSVS